MRFKEELEPALDEVDTVGESDGAGPSSEHVKEKQTTGKDAKGPKKRYIVFVGNLPYSVSKQEIVDFFRDLEPQSVRFLTDKKSNKPRGFAFVEFSDAISLNSALEYHQKTLKGRKINVELTAGGGGNQSMHRKKKIQEKNEKLRAEAIDSKHLNRNK